MSIRAKINFDDQHAKRLFLDAVRCLKGTHRVEIVQYRDRRTDRQNRFYWPAFVQPFADWLSDQQGETVMAETAHSIFKETYLREPIVNEHGEAMFDLSGNPLMRTRSTTELTTTEFNQYLDQCGQLLWDLCKILVPEPKDYHERESEAV